MKTNYKELFKIPVRKIDLASNDDLLEFRLYKDGKLLDSTIVKFK